MLRKKIKVKALEGTPFFISEDEVIGSGSFGRVVKAYNKEEPSSQLVAKIIAIEEDNIESIKAELKILKQIPSHKNLVNCVKMRISSEHNFYLIMEYCNGGTFEKYIEQSCNCSEELIWRFLKDFCAGYQVLYDCHVIHRDIKPENILLHNGKFKIADFGLCRRINHHSIDQNLSIKGTPLYVAPELQSESQGCSKVDMFSLGTVVYRLAYNGAYPFFDQKLQINSVDDYFQHLQKTPLKFPRYPKRSKQFEILVTQMLAKDSAGRLDWKELFKIQKIKSALTFKSEKKKQQEAVQLEFFRRSLMQICKSSAKVKVLDEPFNHQKCIELESQRILEFTEFISKFEADSFEAYALRKKILIELIRHLNGLLRTSIQFPQGSDKAFKKHIESQFDEVIDEGFLYCWKSLLEMKKMIKSYSEEMSQVAPSQIIQRLSDEAEYCSFKVKIKERECQYLKYENTLYDFLSEYIDRPISLKEALKVPTCLMMDIYDGLLKLDSMASVNEKGRVEMIQIELEDAELDKIDYKNLSSYEEYLNRTNEVTVTEVEESLAKMGLIIR